MGDEHKIDCIHKHEDAKRLILKSLKTVIGFVEGKTEKECLQMSIVNYPNRLNDVRGWKHTVRAERAVFE